MSRVEATARERELGDKLRRIRGEAGLSSRELADKLGWSQAKVSRVDTGYRNITEIDVVRYAACCGVNPDRMNELLAFCREATGPGFWMSTRLSSLVFHENTANAVCNYEPLVVPGLLQTEDYATALIGNGQEHEDWVNSAVRVRMERQRLLHRSKLSFYLHEQVLRLPVGGNRVMNEQLLKLVLLAGRPHLSVRVVPAELGAQAVFGGPFVLFTFPGHRPLVYLENGVCGMFLEQQDYVVGYQAQVKTLARTALDEEQSRKLLAALASEYDRAEGPRDGHEQLAQEQLQQRPRG